MMLSDLCRELEWPVDVFHKDHVDVVYPKDIVAVTLELAKVFDPVFLRWVRSVGLTPRKVFLTYTRPGVNVPDVHIDTGMNTFIYAVNFSFCSAGHMQWFKLRDPSASASRLDFGTGPALRWKLDEVDLIAEVPTPTNRPLLVNTAVAHRGFNKDPESYRWSYSLRFFTPTLSWAETLELFKPWLKP